MKKIRKCFFCFLVPIVLAFVCLPTTASTRIVKQESTPNFFGGGCANPTSSGSCKECCLWTFCKAANPCSKKTSGPTACTANIEKINEATGYSCDKTDDPADNCSKSNEGTCSKTYDCAWNVAQGICVQSSFRANQPSYLTCTD